MSTETNTPLDATQVQAARERYAVPLQRYAALQLDSAAGQAKEILEAVWKSFQEQPSAEIAGDRAGEWLFLQCRRRIHALTHGGGPGKRVDAGAAEAETPAGKPAADAEEIEEPPHVTMQRLIGRLTPKQQEAVRLRFQNDFSVQAVARITELTTYNVGVLIHNALAKLARGFRAQHPDESGTAGKGVGIDARLTLYALGEMEDDERTTFEDSLIDKKNAALRVDEIRTIGALIGQALAVEAGAAAPHTVRKNKRRKAGVWLKFPRVLLPLAAGAAMLGLVLFRLVQSAEETVRAPRSRVDFTLKPADWKVGEVPPEEVGGRVGGGEGGFGGLSASGGRNRKEPKAPVAVPMAEASLPGQPGKFPEVAAESAANAPARDGEFPAETEGGDEPESMNAPGTGPALTGPAAINRGKQGERQAVPAATPTGKTGEEELPPSDPAANPAAKEKAPAAPDNPAAGKPAPKSKVPAKPKTPARDPKKSEGRGEKPFVSPQTTAVSRLAPDVPVASVAPLRKALRDGRRPAPNAVKVEELINYFPPGEVPSGEDLFAATLEASEAPWDPKRRLVRVSLKGRPAPVTERGAASLVLLVDISGSMEGTNRLPLVKESVRLLLARLRPDDRVGVVTYAAEPKLALIPTPVEETQEILRVIEGLEAKGPTNGGAGLELAYELAKDHAVPGGKPCVIMCTDGDFNSGPTREEELGRIVDRHQESGVKLSIYGFGRGRQIDVRLEKLAQRGGGASGYVNTRREAEQVLAGEINGLIAPLAQDLELKVSFNPDQVEGYRLLGYDEQAAGTSPPSPGSRAMLPGQTFTALYEVVPKDGAPAGGDLLGLQLRYQTPGDGAGREQSFALRDRGLGFAQAGLDFKFAAAVGVFGLVLKEQAPEGMTLDQVEAWAREALGRDEGGYRSEFLAMVREAKAARPE